MSGQNYLLVLNFFNFLSLIDIAYFFYIIKKKEKYGNKFDYLFIIYSAHSGL